MKNIIRYFNEECIRKFGELREKLYEDPEDLAGFILDTQKDRQTMVSNAIIAQMG